MRLALGQMNATIGDFAGNGAKTEALWRQAEAAGADLLLVPEMALRGNPPRGRLDRPSFRAEAARLLGELARRAGRTALLLGTFQIDRAEYERQQAAPGLRVSTRTFGSGRRIPIAQVSRT